MVTKKTLRTIPYRSLIVLLCDGIITISNGCSSPSTTSQTQQNTSTAVTNAHSSDLNVAVFNEKNYLTKLNAPFVM